MTCDLLDNPYVIPHAHQGQGERIDYILYRARNGRFIFLVVFPHFYPCCR